MNEIIKELIERKSVRVFNDCEISDSDRNMILTAALQAPTAGNQQLYTIIDVKDQAIKNQLAESCDHQPFIAKAKMVLVFVADPLKWHDAFTYGDCKPRELGAGDLLLAIDDALISAQNAVIAAWSLGIGSCYIGDIMENREKQKVILGLPDHTFPAAMVVFGYPTEQQMKREKPERAELRNIVQIDRYHERNQEELQAMLKNNFKGDSKESLQAFCNRKFNSDFSKEMQRSVKGYLEEYSYESGLDVVVPLKIIIDGIEGANADWNQYLDIEKMEVVMLPEDTFEAEFDEDDEKLSELIDEQWNVRFFSLPSQYDIHEYSIMEQFIYSLPKEKDQSMLLNAIRGRGAFRRFKDKLIQMGIVQQWYDYQEGAYRKIAIKWCEDHGFNYSEN